MFIQERNKQYCCSYTCLNLQLNEHEQRRYCLALRRLDLAQLTFERSDRIIQPDDTIVQVVEYSLVFFVLDLDAASIHVIEPLHELRFLLFELLRLDLPLLRLARLQDVLDILKFEVGFGLFDVKSSRLCVPRRFILQSESELLLNLIKVGKGCNSRLVLDNRVLQLILNGLFHLMQSLELIHYDLDLCLSFADEPIVQMLSVLARLYSLLE